MPFNNNGNNSTGRGGYRGGNNGMSRGGPQVGGNGGYRGANNNGGMRGGASGGMPPSNGPRMANNYRQDNVPPMHQQQAQQVVQK